MRQIISVLWILTVFATACAPFDSSDTLSLAATIGYGALSGTVTDSRGQPIQGALVSASHFDGDYKITDVSYTDDHGNWSLPTVIAADYTVISRKNGYRDSDPVSIAVEAKASAKVDLTMKDLVGR
jgi:hypothetical protein